MSLMINKEGIEAYGLYIHLADTLHIVGGFIEYDFNDICLMLGYSKKNIKAKLGRVISDYKLFDFYSNEDGIEMIGLERLRDDIEALQKHKINSSKGGLKRAKNYRNKQEEEQEEFKLGQSYLNMSRHEKIKFVDFIKKKGELPEYKIKAYENAIN